MNSTAAKIRKGSMWIAGTRLVTSALAALTTIALARLLQPSDFGVVAVGLAVVAVVSAVTDMALNQALIHHSKPDDSHLDTAWTLDVLRGLLIGGLMVLAGPAVAAFFGDDRLALVMGLMGGSVTLAGFSSPRLAMLRRELVFWQEFVVQTSVKLTLVFVSVLVAWLTHSYLALVAGAVASNLVRVISSYLAAPYRPRPSLKEARSLLSFSWWLTMTQIVQAINVRSEPLILGKFLGVPALGLFTVANSLSVVPTRETTQPLQGTLFPAFARLRDDTSRLRGAYTRAQTMVSAIALPCGIGMAVVAEPLVLLTMGEKWAGAIFLVEVLAIVVATETLATAMQPLAMANGRTDLVFRRSLQGLAIRMPAIVTGLMLAGLDGYLVARAILAAFSIVFNTRIVRELIGIPIREQLANNWRTLVAATGMATLGFTAAPLFDFGTGMAELTAQIAALGALVGAAYLALLFGAWAAAGRPAGPEREILDMAGAALKRLGLHYPPASKA